MALFGKKKKKEDDFLDLDDDLEKDKGDYGPAGTKTSPPNDSNLGLPGAPTPPSAPSSFAQNDTAILKEKMNTLKAEIEALKSRVAMLEQKAHIKTETEMGEKYGTKPGGGWHY